MLKHCHLNFWFLKTITMCNVFMHLDFLYYLLVSKLFEEKMLIKRSYHNNNYFWFLTKKWKNLFIIFLKKRKSEIVILSSGKYCCIELKLKFFFCVIRVEPGPVRIVRFMCFYVTWLVYILIKNFLSFLPWSFIVL